MAQAAVGRQTLTDDDQTMNHEREDIRSGPMTKPVVVIARIYEAIQPLDRGDRYEDPLDIALNERQLGAVTGGGSQLNEDGTVAFAEIEIELTDFDDGLTAAVEALEQAGAPEGSEMHRDGTVIRQFGTQQCVAVYLDGVSLPDEVYAELDFEEVVESLTKAAGPGSYHGSSQEAEETGLFFFGTNAEEMFSRMEPVLRAFPIGQNARVVVRAGKAGLPSRTVRLPRVAES